MSLEHTQGHIVANTRLDDPREPITSLCGVELKWTDPWIHIIHLPSRRPIGGIFYCSECLQHPVVTLYDLSRVQL